MIRLFLACCAFLLLPLTVMSQSNDPAKMTPDLMGWSDLTSQPLPQPSETLQYGVRDDQVVDIWRPEGEGPHPVVLMVHGGCWQKSIADRTLMNYAAEALRQRGLAVWNIEYRGVDEAGGGYPGTFRDVSDAADLLRDAGKNYGLDTRRVAGFGHSAGGHLVTWLASRKNLGSGHPLERRNPVRMKGIVNSGGLADLEASRPVTLESCLDVIMDELTGRPTEDRPDVLADTSPARLLPPTGKVFNVNGKHDRIAPPVLGEGFAEKIQASGGDAVYFEIADAGHVELIAPGTAAFEVQADLLEALLEEDE